MIWFGKKFRILHCCLFSLLRFLVLNYIKYATICDINYFEIFEYYRMYLTKLNSQKRDRPFSWVGTFTSYRLTSHVSFYVRQFNSYVSSLLNSESAISLQEYYTSVCVFLLSAIFWGHKMFIVALLFIIWSGAVCYFCIPWWTIILFLFNCLLIGNFTEIFFWWLYFHTLLVLIDGFLIQSSFWYLFMNFLHLVRRSRSNKI